MSEIVIEKVAVTTTGSAGSATGSATSPNMNGFLLVVYLDFHASAPATTDTTIAYAERGGNVLAVSNSATDAVFAPRQGLVDNTNTAITGGNAPFPLAGRLTVSLAQCDALTDAVTAWFYYLRA